MWKWVYASLLHDIGYIFQERAGTDQSARKAAQSLFQTGKILRLLRPTNPDHREDYRKYSRFLEDVTAAVPWDMPVYESCSCPAHLLDSLRRLPWAAKLGLPDDAFDLWASVVRRRWVEDLESWAYAVADSGYGNGVATIDHAVASALFLLQWQSYYYWIAERTCKRNKGWYDRFVLRHDQDGTKEPWPLEFRQYSRSVFRTIVAPALFSAARHSVRRNDGWPAWNALLPLSLGEDPVAYLGVICDCLQQWDRYPSGEGLKRSLEMFSTGALCSEDVSLSNRSGKVFVVINGPKQRIGSRIKADLECLRDWRSVVVVQ